VVEDADGPRWYSIAALEHGCRRAHTDSPHPQHAREKLLERKADFQHRLAGFVQHFAEG
jgi:hypothetical protein